MIHFHMEVQEKLNNGYNKVKKRMATENDKKIIFRSS